MSILLDKMKKEYPLGIVILLVALLKCVGFTATPVKVNMGVIRSFLVSFWVCLQLAAPH